MKVPRRALVVMAVAGFVARGGPGPPPKRYTSQAGVTDIQTLELASSPGEASVSMVIPNLGIEIWRHDPTDAFNRIAFLTEPGVYAHVPILLTNPQFHDLFLVTQSGTTITFRINVGGTSTTLTTYNATLAPPRGTVIYTANNFNGNAGPDVAFVAEPDKVLVFGDDGAGGLLPAYTTITLPSGQADLIAGGDIDNDGQADILVGESTTGICRILRNSGGTFNQIQAVTVNQLKNMLCLDLNGDFFADIAATRDAGTTSEDELVVALSSGSPASPFATFLPPVSIDEGSVALAAADVLPTDGDPDLFVTCPGFGSFDELVNDGAGGFTLTGQYFLPFPGQGRSIAAATDGVVGITDAFGHWVAYIPGPDGSVNPAFNIVTGPGPGATNPPRLRVYTGTALDVPVVNFDAYGTPGFGVNVAGGNLDGIIVLHATQEVLTAPGPSLVYGPQVKAWRRDRAGLVAFAKINFYAYGTLRYGCNVASENIDVFQDEILTGAGPGSVFGPHVRAFGYGGGQLSALPRVSFYSYFTLRYGVNPSATNLLGTPDSQLLTAPGPGIIFGPQVRGFTYGGTAIAAMPTVNFYPFTVLQYGGRVAGGDFNAAALEELACSPGPGATSSHPAQFRGFTYQTGSIQQFPGFDVTPFTTYYGGRPATGFVYGIDYMELIAAPGPDPSAAALIYTFSYDTGTLLQNQPTILAYPTLYGVNAASAHLAF